MIRGTYYMKSLGEIYYSSKTSYWYNITWRNVISNDKNVNPVPVYCKSYLGLYTVSYDSYLVWNLEKWQMFDTTTSSNQNSILKKGSGRTFLFQTENLFFNIDF